MEFFFTCRLCHQTNSIIQALTEAESVLQTQPSTGLFFLDLPTDYQIFDSCNPSDKLFEVLAAVLLFLNRKTVVKT